MVDVNVKVSALEKLLDYAASGIGAVAGSIMAPWRARQDAKAKLIEAKAEADSLRLIADAQAEARNTLVAPDEAGHGVLDIRPDGIAQRIEFQERKRQANIESVVRDAATDLGDKEVPDHDPDPDWTARFFNCVQDVSSADIRKLWAKILSGEVEHPGRTSLRTLDILKNMTREDAQLFCGICDFAIEITHRFPVRNLIYYPEEYEKNEPALSYENIVYMRNVGLCYQGFEGFNTWTQRLDQNMKSVVLIYQNLLLEMSTELYPRELRIPILMLTDPGADLCRIMDRTIRMDYLKAFSKFLRENNCELSYAHITEKHLDGRITHTIPFVPIEPDPGQAGGEAS